ncbi:hypothetical protein B296_00058656, partial [Ensete ventricosum]
SWSHRSIAQQSSPLPVFATPPHVSVSYCSRRHWRIRQPKPRTFHELMTFMDNLVADKRCEVSGEKRKNSSMGDRRRGCRKRFGTKSEKVRQEVPLPSPVPSLNQECDEEVLSDPISASAMDVQIAGSSDGHGDVTSVFQSSTGSPEMEFMTNLFEIATLLDLGTDCLE